MNKIIIAIVIALSVIGTGIYLHKHILMVGTIVVWSETGTCQYEGDCETHWNKFYQKYYKVENE